MSSILLPLLEGLENESKNKTPLKTWYENSIVDKAQYKKSNFVPDVDLSLANFEHFIEERKKRMVEKFIQVMNA